MKRLAIIVIACALVVPAASVAGPTSPAPRAKHVTGLAPPIACTMANRLDIFVDEDSILWECTCEVLSSGFACHWQVIGGVDEARIRRKIELRQLPKRFWYHARWRYLSVIR